MISHTRSEQKDAEMKNALETSCFKTSFSYLLQHCISNIYVWFLSKGNCQRVQICPKSTPHVTCLQKEYINIWQKQQKYRSNLSQCMRLAGQGSHSVFLNSLDSAFPFHYSCFSFSSFSYINFATFFFIICNILSTQEIMWLGKAC